MEQRLVCDTVRDLLPLYIDRITSGQSNQSIEEHLQSCEACRAVLKEMQQPIAVETAPEVKDFKKYLKRSKAALLAWIMGAAAAIAIVTCFIVNLAVDGQLSWFYIVAAGIITAYAPVAVWIYGAEKTHRLEKGLAVLNICVFVLLGTIQLVLYQCMGMGDIWFWNKGLPIAVLWSAVVWISIAVKEVLRINWILAGGVLAALAVWANYLTNVLVGEWESWQEYLKCDFVSNGLGNAVIAVVLLVTGVCVQRRKR